MLYPLEKMMSSENTEKPQLALDSLLQSEASAAIAEDLFPSYEYIGAPAQPKIKKKRTDNTDNNEPDMDENASSDQSPASLFFSQAI